MGNNILDLVFVNDQYALFDLEVIEPFCTSDHSSVVFKLVYDKSVGTMYNQTKQVRYNFSKANWSLIVESTAAVDWDFLFSGVNYDSIWKVFSDKLYEIIDNHVPKVVYGSQARSKIRNYPKVIRDLITRKKILWRNWKIHKSDISKSKYYQAAKNVRQAIIEFVSEKESQVVKSNNLGRFFKYVNRK